MELELDSSNSNCPLGHSLTKSELDSSITSPELDSHSPPSSDHHNHNHNHDHDHQSSDFVNDQLNSLSIDDEKVVADNNGGEDGGCEEERENNGVEIGEEKGEIENGVEIGEDVNKNEELSKNEEEENKNEDLSKNEEENKNEELSEKERESNSRNNKRSYTRFPVRPDAEDCAFYLKTGVCKFGMNCKFNHPPNHKKFQGAKVKVKEEGVDSAAMKEKDETVDKEQIECKYFDRPGGCKFGKACKFNHIKKANPSKLNFMGLPIRPGEKECPFYMRNGSCKYGANCRFNHPDPTTIGVADALPRYSNGGSIFSPNVSQSTLAPWSPTTLNESPPYVPLMFSPTQGFPPQPPEWNAYQAPVYPPERNVHMPPAYALNKGLLEGREQMQGDEFPERPGQPECSYFLKTGNCKYKSACKFHHPKSAMAQSPSCHLSDLGLPLRPGENVCSHYSRYGICKYGPACKYDHPINHAHSSELTISAVDQTPALGDTMVNNQTMAAGS